MQSINAGIAAIIALLTGGGALGGALWRSLKWIINARDERTRKEIDDRLSNLTAMVADYAGRTESMRKDLDASEIRADRLELRAERLETELDKIKQKNADLQERNTRLTKRVAELEQSEKQLKERILELEGRPGASIPDEPQI